VGTGHVAGIRWKGRGFTPRPARLRCTRGEGEIVAAWVANLSVTFDHRTVDGRTAAQLLWRVIELIESRPVARRALFTGSPADLASLRARRVNRNTEFRDLPGTQGRGEW
jgi:hypothetical protein